ncbi:MAG: HAD family hydrolase [Planctomycetota bacterium]
MASGRWPSRSEAEALLREYTANPNPIKHALAVEAAMRGCAARFSADADAWGGLGLLHDFDYEQFPDPARHGREGARILTGRGYADDLASGLPAHIGAPEAPRATPMLQALCGGDDLTGLIVAVALVRPSRKPADVTIQAVQKKWSEKGFAAGADRGAAERGARELGLPLDEFIGLVLTALQGSAPALGL